ncbi:hypothetical protein ACMD2_14106 [Ananas comosus]|uniref:Uncharacterized protein n=1 Tax=Ananas comosus TaxID=4615 RepID=A0A199VAT5_ANACO|nr:hypothetical protein ACMD2_14106 [Ananas comosus]
MSPEQSQYIWRKTIPHIEVGMGSGVFTSHRSARGAAYYYHYVPHHRAARLNAESSSAANSTSS